jgi:hypothetical protein
VNIAHRCMFINSGRLTTSISLVNITQRCMFINTGRLTASISLVVISLQLEVVEIG